MKQDNRSRSVAKSERYEQILTAAAGVIARKGYRASSITDIADALGLTSGSLYHYVDSKSDLLADICNRAGLRLHESAVAVVDMGLPARESLQLVIQNHLQLIDAEREIFTVLIQERSEVPITKLDAHSERAYFQLVRNLVERAFDLPAHDSTLIAHSLLGALNWTLRWYRRDGAYTPEEIGEKIFELFSAGFP